MVARAGLVGLRERDVLKESQYNASQVHMMFYRLHSATDLDACRSIGLAYSESVGGLHHPNDYDLPILTHPTDPQEIMAPRALLLLCLYG